MTTLRERVAKAIYEADPGARHPWGDPYTWEDLVGDGPSAALDGYRAQADAAIATMLPEWSSVMETLRVLGNRENAERTYRAMDNIADGNVVEIDLDDLMAGKLPDRG